MPQAKAQSQKSRKKSNQATAKKGTPRGTGCHAHGSAWACLLAMTHPTRDPSVHAFCLRHMLTQGRGTQASASDIECDDRMAEMAQAEVEIQIPALVLVPEVVRPVDRHGRDGRDDVDPHAAGVKLAIGISANHVPGIHRQPTGPADQDQGMLPL